MKLPALHIGNLTATVPIVQGGMGIGVSLSGLASAVANEGGVGVISAANVGFNEPDFKTNTVNANLRALKSELLKAREKAKTGIIGVNIMSKGHHYEDYARCAAETVQTSSSPARDFLPISPPAWKAQTPRSPRSSAPRKQPASS